MFLKRYSFGVALFANIWFRVLSSSFNPIKKCVTDSFGNFEHSYVLELRVTAPPNVLDIPSICFVEGVKAEVCSEDDDLSVVVTDLDKIFVSSEKPVTVDLQLYCVNTPNVAQLQEGSDSANANFQEKQNNSEDVQEVQDVQDVPQVNEPKVPKVKEPKALKVKEPKIPKGVALASPASRPDQANVALLLQNIADVNENAQKVQENVEQVIEGAVRTQKSIDKTQASVEKARKKLAKSYAVGSKAQFRVFRAEHSIAKAQWRIHKAQEKIRSAQKRANKAQHNVDKATKRAEKAKRRVERVQIDVY